MKTLFRPNLLGFLVVLFMISCASVKTQEKPNSQTISNMKPMNQFDPEWREIDSLVDNGYPKSALAKLAKLEPKIRKSHHPGQLIKWVTTKVATVQQIEENSNWKNYQRLQQEITKAEMPAKQVLQYHLAQFLKTWTQNNRWRMRKRTAVANSQEGDLRTWSLRKLEEETDKLLKLAIADNGLKSIPVSALEPGMIKGKGTEGLRPTVYDLLAHHVLDYYMMDINFLTEPAYKFYLDNPDYFAEADIFAKAKIESKDKLSRKAEALRIFQKLTKEHLGDTDALIDLELKRLKFVHNHYVGAGNDSLYLVGLERLRKKSPNSSITASVMLTMAHYYNGKALLINYSKAEEKYRDANKKAVTLLKEAIRLYPKTWGAEQCHNLLVTIETEKIGLHVEDVYLPQKPGLLNLSFTNIKNVILKIYKLNNPFELFSIQEKDNWKDYLHTQPVVAEKKYQLQADLDYNSYETELVMPALPYGQYYAEVIGNEGDTKAFASFQVSDLAGIEMSDSPEGAFFKVVSRTTGGAIRNAEVRAYPLIDYRRSDWKNPNVQKTNHEGIAKAIIHKKDTNNRIVIAKEADLLIYANYLYFHYFERYGGTAPLKTEYFLDRAIYRPGQTVYFKGLAIKKDKDEIPHIRVGQKIEVTLMDANNQKVKTLSFVTNEYGTFSGQFKLPANGLNGRFSLSSKNGWEGFRVEDYKRPKFEVSLFEPKEAYSVGDKITVKGDAKNYSGASLDGAMVKYTVTRDVQYPYRNRWSHWYNPAPTTQIVTGETKTLPDGSFELYFDALPDRSVSKKDKATFSYSVDVTVTDVTGETHEAYTFVTVGYISLMVDVPLQEKMNIDDLKVLKIASKNLNGEFVPAKGTIKLERLRVPDSYYINRLWAEPTIHVIPEKEFKEKFPHFAYDQEDKIQNWPVRNLIFEEQFDTEVADSVLVSGELEAGSYKLVLSTKDTNGEQIDVVKFVQLAGKGTSYAGNAMFEIKNLTPKLQPGQVGKVMLSSAGKVIYWMNTARYNRNDVLDFDTVNRSKRIVDFAVTEQDRGGFSSSIMAVYQNRFFSRRVQFNVPWDNKELKITYESVRDKLYPGQKEKWRIKISGPKADAAAAEVVATLYDASLDAFSPNYWYTNFYPTRHSGHRAWNEFGSFGLSDGWGSHSDDWAEHDYPFSYDRLVEMDLYRYINQWQNTRRRDTHQAYSIRELKQAPAPVAGLDGAVAGVKTRSNEMAEADEDSVSKEKPKPISPRTNLKETVFFMPDLRTDGEGNVILEFTMNEALTRWHFMTFAHDKDLRFGYADKEVITQKELMVVPNPPRFLREFDEIEFSAKVVNMSDMDLHPNVELQLLDELHTMPVYKWLDNPQFNKVIAIPKGRSAAVSFRFKVPSVGETPLIKWTLTAASNKFSDSESGYLPVVTNRTLVTESMPLPIKAKESKTFSFDAMKKATQSQTLEHQSFTLEFTSNPAWYAVQALPYIMEYPHECSEQIFSRLYANTLALSVVRAHPKIKKVFDQWRTTDTEALASNLSKNQELKSALLEETPWVMNAISEEEQKKNIGLLFDLEQMSIGTGKAMHTLIERQSKNGGFAWFPGGHESWYITQYIVEGFGHLRKLEALPKGRPEEWKMAIKALGFVDRQLKKEYDELARQVKMGHAKWEDDHLNNLIIHYLYARSFFLDKELPDDLRKPYKYYLGQAKEYWFGKGLYQEGLIALALKRNNEKEAALNIMKSIKERSITNEELGMYWKQSYGYHWYQLPVETNALMIEAFAEILQDDASVYQLKVWLLKNKQTTHWKTTKATASAVYALLMNGENWLLEDKPIDIKVGNRKIQPDKMEAGTGYFKQSWDKETMPTNMSEISVSNPNASIAWGAVYWQYFEDLDKVKVFKDTPLKLKKELYRETISDRGPVLAKINQGDVIHVGDKLKMRIELRVDRAMEYVHMKDMRAAGFEPTNVLSQYKWQDGLGYYESTRDLATDFFFGYLSPGVYVFEYPLTAQLKGNFSNGVTTIQCMYAPEFTSHSEGVRVIVE